MSTTALQAANQVLLRARDPNGIATSQATVFDFMSRVQTAVNAGVSQVLGSATLNVGAMQSVYSISQLLPDAVKIIGVRDAFSRDLDPIPFNNLRWLNETWFREVGPELRSYATLGQDLLILRPNVTVATTVTVYYAEVTPKLNVGGDPFTIPDEDVRFVMDFTEALLDFKARDLDDLKPILERLEANIKAVETEIR